MQQPVMQDPTTCREAVECGCDALLTLGARLPRAGLTLKFCRLCPRRFCLRAQQLSALPRGRPNSHPCFLFTPLLTAPC